MKELLVFFSAMIPLTEISGSIPLGLSLGLSNEATMFWSILGLTVITFALLTLFDLFDKHILVKIPFLNNFVKKYLNKIHTKHGKKFEQTGIILLFIFVLIPGPGTGTYTASLLSYLFKTPILQSGIAIILGNIGAGILILGGVETIKHFFFQ